VRAGVAFSSFFALIAASCLCGSRSHRPVASLRRLWVLFASPGSSTIPASRLSFLAGRFLLWAPGTVSRPSSATPGVGSPPFSPLCLETGRLCHQFIRGGRRFEPGWPGSRAAQPPESDSLGGVGGWGQSFSGGRGRARWRGWGRGRECWACFGAWWGALGSGLVGGVRGESTVVGEARFRPGGWLSSSLWRVAPRPHPRGVSRGVSRSASVWLLARGAIPVPRFREFLRFRAGGIGRASLAGGCGVLGAWVSCVGAVSDGGCVVALGTFSGLFGPLPS